MGVSNNNDNNIHSNLSATSAMCVHAATPLVPQPCWSLHHCEAAAHLSLN